MLLRLYEGTNVHGYLSESFNNLKTFEDAFNENEEKDVTEICVEAKESRKTLSMKST